MNLSPWVTFIVNLLIVGGASGAGALAFKRQYQQNLSTIQERVIAALKEEGDAQTVQIANLHNEVDKLRDTISTIRLALKRRGIIIRINGEYVTLVDVSAPQETTVKISKEAVGSLAAKDDEGGKEHN